MIILYTMLSTSPNIRKISMMLNETGLPYTVQKFERQSDGKLPEDFLAIKPNGTVPAILDEDNGAVLLSPAQFCIIWQKNQDGCCHLISKPVARCPNG